MTYRRQDSRYRRAKTEGYRARSAYKLAELDDRYHLLGRGDRVIDLGAWPGGWLQVAVERIGPAGRIVGVDITPVAAFPAPNVELLTGDVRDRAVVERIRAAAGRRADVVLSDLAPKLSGVRATDQARCAELVDAVLDALPILLRPDGSLLIKLFMSDAHAATVTRLEQAFARVRVTRPAATRLGSAELYAVGHEYAGC